MTRAETRRYGLILSVLAFLFFLRVLGQVLVAFFDVRWLPAMAEWYSGLLAYPLLLPGQLLILVVQAKVSADLLRGHGSLTRNARVSDRFFAGSASCTSPPWHCATS